MANSLTITIKRKDNSTVNWTILADIDIPLWGARGKIEKIGEAVLEYHTEQHNHTSMDAERTVEAYTMFAENDGIPATTLAKLTRWLDTNLESLSLDELKPLSVAVNL